MKRALFFCGILLVAVATQAQQTIRVPQDTSPIQAAINIANDGDTILVADAVYYEQIDFSGKKITVASHFLIDGDTNHINNTILDGSQFTDPDNASVVYFRSGEDTTSILCGFTIKKGGGTFYTTPYVFRGGGGVFIAGSGAKIIHNHITENNLTDTLHGNPNRVTGAGIHFKWEEDTTHWVVVDHNKIDFNSCYCSSVETAAAGLVISCNSRITNNIIAYNTVTGVGNSWALAAAFACANNPAWTTSSKAFVENNIITNNLAQSANKFAHSAGGFFQAVTGTFSSNYVANNQVISGIPGNGGAAGLLIYAPREDNVVRNNHFFGNISNVNVGALACQSLVTDPSQLFPILVENNYFIGNQGVQGGALGTLDSPILLQNNVFTENFATQYGGAIFVNKLGSFQTHHQLKVMNNSFHHNIADINGGAIYTKSKNLIVVNSVFWKDSCTSTSSGGQEIYVLDINDTVEFVHTNIDPSKVRGLIFDGGGNINSDPLFDDPITLITTNGSPCVDNGIESYTCLCGDVHYAPGYDIRGFMRPTGEGYDMGAYDLQYWVVGFDEITKDGLRITSSPNPFTSHTTFAYTVDKSSNVRLTIYNGYGQQVALLVNGFQTAGEQKMTWYAGNLPAGMYYYRFEVGGKVSSGKTVKY